MGDGRRQVGGPASERQKQRRLRAGFLDRSARRGPLTAAGKARASQNARRHGLSPPALSDPAASAEIKDLVRKICRFGADASANADLEHRIAAAYRELTCLARRIAEAQVDLVRVRRARHNLISWALSNPRYRPGKGLHAWIKQLARAGEFLKQGLALPPDMCDAMEFRPQGAEKLTLILSDASAELARMDRYERRALSRRKFAIREFDAARAGVVANGPIAPNAAFGATRR